MRVYLYLEAGETNSRYTNKCTRKSCATFALTSQARTHLHTAEHVTCTCMYVGLCVCALVCVSLPMFPSHVMGRLSVPTVYIVGRVVTANAVSETVRGCPNTLEFNPD